MKRMCTLMASLLLFGLLSGCSGKPVPAPESSAAPIASGTAENTTGTQPGSSSAESSASTAGGSAAETTASTKEGTGGPSPKTTATAVKTTTPPAASSEPAVNPNERVTMTLEPVQLHPGVAGMDAFYTFTCFEKDTDKLVNAAFVTLKTSDSSVFVNDLTIQVPYTVRQNKEYIDLTVVKRDNPDEVGRYRLHFDWKYTEDATFAEEFDKIDERIWNDTFGTVGDLSKLLKDGKAAFNIVPDGNSYKGEGIYTDWGQEYGCFSASIDMPLMGGDYILAAWWLKSPEGTVYSPNPDDPTSSHGELDIVEWTPAGGYPFCTFHYNGWKPGQTISSASTFINQYGQSFLNGFHTYSAVWSDKAIWWYYDGNLVKTLDDPAAMGKNKMHLCLQMGLPDPAKVQGADLPVEMQVDWVKVHQFTKKP